MKNMDKIAHRAVIRYLFINGLSPKDIVSTVRDITPSYSVVKTWAVEFKRGRKGLEGDPPEGRPPIVTTQENINKIHDMSMADR